VWSRYSAEMKRQRITPSSGRCPAKISAELNRDLGLQNLSEPQNRHAADQMIVSHRSLLLNRQIEPWILKTISTDFAAMVRS
jgi:hypothetical protein